MTTGLLRNRYVTDGAETASPARLVTMLYDRLVLDLVRAEAAQRAGDREETAKQLLHAQDIVLELISGLRPEAWDGGPGLLALYTFVYGELVAAYVNSDADRTASCRLLVEPLRDAWHAAASEFALGSSGTDAARVG